MPDRQPARKEKSHSSLCLACSTAEQITFYSNNRILWKLSFSSGLTRKGMAEDKQLERFLRPNLHGLSKLMHHCCHNTGALGNHELPRRSEICPQNVLTFCLLTLLMTPNGFGKLLGHSGSDITNRGCPPWLCQRATLWASKAKVFGEAQAVPAWVSHTDGLGSKPSRNHTWEMWIFPKQTGIGNPWKAGEGERRPRWRWDTFG